MIESVMEIAEQYPVRKSRKQKAAFREDVLAYANRIGYETHVETGNYGLHNVILGDPARAKYLVTAHYDTCAHLPFPNLLTPCNFPVYLAYQLLIVVIFIVADALITIPVWFVFRNTAVQSVVTYWTAYLTWWVLLALMLVGPANRHNANDNTSGVVTLLEIASTLPENQRKNVAFVLFDLEEAGLLGSAAYRKAHKQETEHQLVLNLDCVGDGDEILLFPTKKLRKSPDKLELLRPVCGVFGKKSITLREKGWYSYPSDQKNFPYGVGIAAFRRKKGIGLYCGRIHTNRDTVLEITNVNLLRAAISTLISGCA